MTLSGEQHARSESGPSGSSHRRSVTPTASGSERRSATALSTPPLIATATRPGDGAAREGGPERVRERVDRERLAADGRRLEQRQAREVALEPGRVGVDDPVAVHAQPDGRPLAVAARVSERSPAGSPYRGARPRRPNRAIQSILVPRWVPCPRSAMPRGRRAPFQVALDLHVCPVRATGLPAWCCWFTICPGPRKARLRGRSTKRIPSSSAPRRDTASARR